MRKLTPSRLVSRSHYAAPWLRYIFFPRKTAFADPGPTHTLVKLDFVWRGNQALTGGASTRGPRLITSTMRFAPPEASPVVNHSPGIPSSPRGAAAAPVHLFPGWTVLRYLGVGKINTVWLYQLRRLLTCQRVLLRDALPHSHLAVQHSEHRLNHGPPHFCYKFLVFSNKGKLSRRSRLNCFAVSVVWPTAYSGPLVRALRELTRTSSV